MTGTQMLAKIKTCIGDILTIINANEKIGKENIELLEQLELLVMMHDSVKFDSDITSNQLEKVKRAVKSCDCTPDFSDC